MLYFLFNKGQFVQIAPEQPFTGTPKLKDFGFEYDSAKCSPDFNSMEEVTKLAAEVSAKTGKTYIPYDNGDHTSHRFGVMEVPQVGDEVSQGFNGDYYPCGKIIRVTPSLRVIAEDDRGRKTTFNRKRQTACWLRVGGTFAMVAGIHDERNPHF